MAESDNPEGSDDAGGGDASGRKSPRQLAAVTAEISRGDDPVKTALIRDISVTGALLLTRKKLEVGEALKLSLYFSHLKAQDAVVVSATVVRSEARPRAVADVWSHSAAVKFGETLEKYSKEITEVAARQKEIFGDS